MGKLAIVKLKLDREVNCYLVSDAGSKEAVVIDPGMPAEKIVEQAAGVTVKHILATHGHPGHVGGKDDVKEATGGQTGIHSLDAKQFLRSADHYLLDGDELEFGEFKIQVLHTPGHQPCIQATVRPPAWSGSSCRTRSFAEPAPGPEPADAQADGLTRLIRILVTPDAEFDSSVPPTRLSLLRMNFAVNRSGVLLVKLIVQSVLFIWSA
ncbi:MAG: MBL fold metallo-hydrolase [Chloroflexi bacterium]|nr:MAG: MBL fold metallo-hydrolase [Chloroflexota bacterium]